MPDDREFAIVALPSEPGPLRSLFTSNARMVGDFKAVMGNILDSRQQRDLRLYVARGDALMRAEQVIEAKKTKAAMQKLAAECDQLMARVDAFEERKEREALRVECDEQARRIIDTYEIPDDLPELDEDADPPGINGPSVVAEPDAGLYSAPEGDFPAENLRPLGEPKGDYPQPTLYPSLRDGAAPDGWLPSFLEQAGTEPISDARARKRQQPEAPQMPATSDI
jgi:hypothetical protein